MKKEYIINACLYQAGWFSCMLLPQSPLGFVLTLTCVAVHLKFKKIWINEILFISIATITGYAMDKGMDYFELMNITTNNNNSLYLILIWVLFSTSLRSSSSFVFNKLNYCLLLGLIAPLAYVGGQALGRIKYSSPQLVPIAIHSSIWILTMLVLFYVNNKFPANKK